MPVYEACPFFLDLVYDFLYSKSVFNVFGHAMSANMSAPVRYGLKAMYEYLKQFVEETLNTHISALVRVRFH